VKRQKAQRTDKRYTRQDGRILVQDVPRGADSTQPGLPRPAQTGEVNHLRGQLLWTIQAGERAQRMYADLFPPEGAAGTQGVQSKFTLSSLADGAQ